MKLDIPSIDFKFNIWNYVFQIFLSNGCIITFVVSLHTGDIDRVVIDKSLVGKLNGENPSHGRLHFRTAVLNLEFLQEVNFASKIHVCIYCTWFQKSNREYYHVPSTKCLNIKKNIFSNHD